MEHPKHRLKLMGKKIFSFTLKNFVHLNICNIKFFEKKIFQECKGYHQTELGGKEFGNNDIYPIGIR